MIFAIVCTDKPNQKDARAANREAHFAHLKAHKAHIIEAGPLQAEDRSHSVGSLLIVDFEDRIAAESFATNDPFNQAGIFESVVIRPYKKVLP